jgi:AraC-like DNA-binding protein
MNQAVPPRLEVIAPRRLPGQQHGSRLPNAAFIDWAHHPALICAFAQDQELPQTPLLAAIGQATPPPAGRGLRLSSAQLLAMLRSLRQLHDQADTAFLLGQSWLPGHYGPASHALLEAATLGEALGLLCDQAARLCPLQAPRLVACGQDLLLCWIDAGLQLGAMRPFVIDLHMSAVRSVCEWLGEQPLPWRFHFNRTRPRRTEQHEVYLGDHLQFDCHLDAMRLPASCLSMPWPRHRAMRAAAARAALAAEGPVALGLLDRLHEHLLHNLQARAGDVSLEGAARGFGISEATLKRQLAAAGTHFQAELDQVRSHLALYLMHEHGWGNEALAQAFGFHDRTNFRRAFKRWTGLTPSLLRARWP